MKWFSRLNSLNKFSSIALLLQLICVVIGSIYLNTILLIFSLLLCGLVLTSCLINRRRLNDVILGADE